MIYIYKKDENCSGSVSGIGFNRLTGDTTEERLNKIQRQQRKRTRLQDETMSDDAAEPTKMLITNILGERLIVRRKRPK